MLFSLFVSSALAITPLWVYAPTQSDIQVLQTLPLGFTEQQRGSWIRMDADAEGLDALRLANIPFTIAPSPVRSVPAGYHSPEDMNEALIQLASDHPNTSELLSLGYSENGREILALRVGSSEENALAFRILGAHHGDELPSGELVLAFAERLLSSNDSDTLALLETANIWLVPHVNPDGVEAVRRYNANNVDLNRNYGYMWNANEYRPGDGPFSEKETQNIRQLGYWHHAAAALSLHAGATNIGWVWNYTTQRSSDDDAVEALANDYASYCTQNDFWTTNGADWYVTYGDTTDWAYGAHGVFDFTLEVSSSKQPPSSQLPRILSDHLPAMEKFVQWPYWTSLTVVDAETGMPISARLEESTSQKAHLGDPDGHLSVLFPSSGSYSLELSADGYQALSLTATAGQALGTVGLEALNLSDLLPAERVFIAGSTVQFTFDSQSLTATSEGQEPQLLNESNGQWRLDGSELRPGVYHLEHDTGLTRHALLLESPNQQTQIETPQFNDDHILLTATGVGAGITAWGVTEEHRHLVELQIELIDTGEYKITYPSIGSLDTKMTFLYNSGEIIALTEPEIVLPDTGPEPDSGEPSQPTSEPDSDTPVNGSPDNEESLKVGCQSVPIQLPFVLPLLILGIRRR